MKHSPSKRPSPRISLPSLRPSARARGSFGLALAASLALGCGGPQSAAGPTLAHPTYDPTLSRFFDDDVDFVADVGALDARFVREWGQQIDGLAQHSDVVAEVRVEGVSHSNDQDGTDRMGMTLAVSRVFHGACAAEDRLTVSTRRGGSGYRTLGANTTRLQTGRFVAFVRYYQGELGRTRAHWHLSAWSQPLAERLTPADPNERVVYSSSSVRSR